ncbi:MAG: tetratricopeptide repeat-containing sensor histidine kinase [Cyclobacteriaceae bacterium]|nr:tetratricopeptide repeat-containing sensor histidine kinase [Cyclobacteriaceae bacterium]UYN86337.1 MAG: tetratricopeptide repeat-containing sensor histidine kinase [Cyclobacteriaceae bacterium]
MRHFIVYSAVLLFLIKVSSVIGQSNAYLDSLERGLAVKMPDTARVSLLLSLANSYTFKDFSKSLAYAREASALAEKTGSRDLKLTAYRSLGLINHLGGDFTTALTLETKALQIGIEKKDSTEIGRSYSNIGNYYYELGVYDDAYFYLTTAYSILNAGTISKNDSILMNIVIHNVGRVFKEMGQFETALQHLRLAQKVSKKLGDTEGNPYALDEIGDVMLRIGKYDSALIYLQQAVRETNQLLAGDPENIVKELRTRTLIKIARVYMFLKEFDNALAYYDSTARLHELTNNQFGIAEVELGRGTLFLNQGNYIEAENHFDIALEAAKKLHAKILEINCYNELAKLWESKGEYKRSLEFFKKYKALNDSLFSEEMQQKLFRDQVRFATASKDEQIQSLTRLEEFRKAEMKRQEFISNVLVVVMALVVILLVTVYRSGQRRKRINELLLQHQEDMEKRSVELEQLNQVKDKFFSIISHDLRSPINALAGLLDLMDKGAIRNEEMPMAIKELRTRFNHTRTLLNNLLDWTLLQMDKINLQPAKINLKNLTDENIELIQSLQSKEIKFMNEVSPQANAYADSNTINLVIRNLISNALKFTNEGGEIKISAEEKANEWVVSVSDNGVGMKPEVVSMLFDKINPYSTRGTANEKGTGLGLILCKEFVEKNNGRIWVESEEGKGSTFWFTLPKA